MYMMTAIPESQLPKHDFDWEYYLIQNDDVKKAKITGLDACYRHWQVYGCYENRPVRSLQTLKESRFKLKRTPMVNTFTNQPKMTPKVPIELGFKIAVLIHLFDISLFPFFISYLNHLGTTYSHHNFDIYINVVKENSPYRGGDLKAAVADHVKRIDNPNLAYFFNDNRGGDIGGLLWLSKHIISLPTKYRYVSFAHSKTRQQWRIDLCRAIFNLPFELLPKTPNVGLIGSQNWVKTFNPGDQQEYRRFHYHLVDLCETYGVKCDQPWQFIAGTMFLANIKVIEYLVEHQIDQVYLKLNRLDSIDINWLSVVTNELHKDPKGAGNDLQYRSKYGKPLHPDYMIEHTYERVIGLVCQSMGLTVTGVGR